MKLLYLIIDMSADPKGDPIQYILKSPISDVLIKGFAETYKVKPQFPIEFLGKWLKQYSKGQKRQAELQSSRSVKEEKIAYFQQQLLEKDKKKTEKAMSELEKKKQSEQQFMNKVEETNYLVDLFFEYLPETIKKLSVERGVPLTGVYIGQLTFRRKKLEENNFQPNAEFDTESPKVIEYVGAIVSHRFMINQILPNESGRSYEVFKEEQPPAEDEEGKVAQKKKKYLYVPLVQRDEKMYFFKFPRLGSFACFPLRIKSCLSTEAFDKGIGDYKAFVKAKEEIQKEYSEKHSQAKSAYEQAKRKYEQHEGSQQDPAFVADHAVLLEQFKKTQQTYNQIESNPPVIEPFKYETKARDYIISVDTMGSDTEISEEVLSYIDQKVDYIKEKWESKEFKMLLSDIHQYLEEEHTLQNLDSYFKDQERGIISTYESQIKEQFVNRQKEAQYELTLIKFSKLFKILQEQSYVNSLNAYLSYNLPKYKEIIQIILMILGHPKDEINLPKSNVLNHRRCIKKVYIGRMLSDLEKYELRRESSEAVQNQYKINKLLERLEKIDGAAVGQYNAWLYAMLIIAKQLCWARIQCRDAKIEAYEAKVKAKNERDAEITKYLQECQKAFEAAKAELTEQTLPTFNEEDWRKTYSIENVKPEALNVDQLKQFLDIQ